MSKLASLTVAAAAVAVLGFLFSAPVLTVAVAQTSDATPDGAPDGKAVFLDQRCNLCHSVSTVGIEAKTRSETMRGPDLVDLERDAEWLEGWLEKVLELDGEKHKKAFTGSDEELATLIDWLLEQES